MTPVRLALACCLTIATANAHAILKDSIPASNSTVQGPEVEVRLQFNSRIDAAHSRLYLDDGNGPPHSVEIEKQPSPDTLVSDLKSVKPGTYRIEWQVLATDGHITRGELPFTVR